MSTKHGCGNLSHFTFRNNESNEREILLWNIPTPPLLTLHGWLFFIWHCGKTWGQSSHAYWWHPTWSLLLCWCTLNCWWVFFLLQFTLARSKPSVAFCWQLGIIANSFIPLHLFPIWKCTNSISPFKSESYLILHPTPAWTFQHLPQKHLLPHILLPLKAKS